MEVDWGDKRMEMGVWEMALEKGMYVKGDKMNVERDEIEFWYYDGKD